MLKIALSTVLLFSSFSALAKKSEPEPDLTSTPVIAEIPNGTVARLDKAYGIGGGYTVATFSALAGKHICLRTMASQRGETGEVVVINVEANDKELSLRFGPQSKTFILTENFDLESRVPTQVQGEPGFVSVVVRKPNFSGFLIKTEAYHERADIGHEVVAEALYYCK